MIILSLAEQKMIVKLLFDMINDEIIDCLGYNNE